MKCNSTNSCYLNACKAVILFLCNNAVDLHFGHPLLIRRSPCLKQNDLILSQLGQPILTEPNDWIHLETLNTLLTLIDWRYALDEGREKPDPEFDRVKLTLSGLLSAEGLKLEASKLNGDEV